MKHFLFLVLFAATVARLQAQNTCTQRLNQAEDDYQTGRLLGIPDRLQICLQSGAFSKEEEKRARKLLTLVYIFTDQEPEAEAAMINLLKVDPEHQLDPQVDPAEIYFLYDQFRVDPIFRVALRGGVNSSMVNVIRERHVGASDFPKFYNGKASRELTPEESEVNFNVEEGFGTAFWGEMLFERHMGKGIELAFGPQVRFSNFHVETLANGMETRLTNHQFNLRSPLLVRYTLRYGNRNKSILPYVFAGGSFDYLVAAYYSSLKRTGGISYTESEIDLISNEKVNRMNYSLTGGIGVKIRAATNFITVEVRLDNSLKAYTIGANAFADQKVVFNGAFVEDDLSLNFLSVSLGYTFSVYNPKKIQ